MHTEPAPGNFKLRLKSLKKRSESRLTDQRTNCPRTTNVALIFSCSDRTSVSMEVFLGLKCIYEKFYLSIYAFLQLIFFSPRHSAAKLCRPRHLQDQTNASEDADCTFGSITAPQVWIFRHDDDSLM